MHMMFFTDWLGEPPKPLDGSTTKLDVDGDHDGFWIPNKDLQEKYGYAMLGFIAYHMYVNLSIISYYTFRGAFLI